MRFKIFKYFIHLVRFITYKLEIKKNMLCYSLQSNVCNIFASIDKFLCEPQNQ